MDWIPLLYFLIAWYTGGPLFRRLCYVELLQPLSTELQPHYGLIPDGRVWSFSYWHMLLVLLCNPVVVLHYADISAALCAFFYAVAVIVYQFACYCMFLYLLLHFSCRLWHIVKRYNRGSIVRHSFYFLRCYIRDLHEGHSAMPHLLHTSLLFCFLWGATRCVLSETLLHPLLSLLSDGRFEICIAVCSVVPSHCWSLSYVDCLLVFPQRCYASYWLSKHCTRRWATRRLWLATIPAMSRLCIRAIRAPVYWTVL